MAKITKNSSETPKKEYVVIYQSQEHFEVLGFINASSIEEAKSATQEKLLNEAKHYNVAEAEIAELKDVEKISFDISR